MSIVIKDGYILIINRIKDRIILSFRKGSIILSKVIEDIRNVSKLELCTCVKIFVEDYFESKEIIELQKYIIRNS